MKCKWCIAGLIYVDGSSLCYRCTDCGGTGRVPDPDDEPTTDDEAEDES